MASAFHGRAVGKNPKWILSGGGKEPSRLHFPIWWKLFPAFQISPSGLRWLGLLGQTIATDRNRSAVLGKPMEAPLEAAHQQDVIYRGQHMREGGQWTLGILRSSKRVACNAVLLSQVIWPAYHRRSQKHWATQQGEQRNLNLRGYRADTLQMGMFTQAAREFGNVPTGAAEEMSDTLAKTKTLSKAAQPVYSWSSEIDSISKECIKARRLMQQARGSDSFQERHITFSDRRRDLKSSTRDNKRKYLLELCDSAENIPWSLQTCGQKNVRWKRGSYGPGRAQDHRTGVAATAGCHVVGIADRW